MSAPRVAIARLVPQLLVRDMAESLAFYKKLGFEPPPDCPSNATWAEVVRDGVTLHFHTEPPDGTPPQPIMSGTLYMFPASVDALAREFDGVVPFAWGPETMPYGMREFGIQDPNGYYLAFTEPA